jgi:hypothetical protein
MKKTLGREGIRRAEAVETEQVERGVLARIRSGSVVGAV